MGYRNSLAKMPKHIYEKIKDLSYEQLVKKFGEDAGTDEAYFYYSGMPGYKTLYGLGKYCDFDIEDKKTRFFTKKMEFEEDIEVSLATKELLLQIIEENRAKVEAWYENAFKEKTYEELKSDTRGMFIEWSKGSTPYNLDDNTDCIVCSWKYEYVIFELVRIYKTFDWENDVLLYVGS